MYLLLFNIVAPVMLCALLGYRWARSGKIYDTAMITNLVVTIGTPALVFRSLVNIHGDLATLGHVALASALALASFAVVAMIVLRLAGLSYRAFLPAMTFPNTGNMGLPLALLAFGDAGLAFAVAYFAICVVFQFTFGIVISSGSASPRALMRIPTLYAVALALVFLISGIRPPAWLADTANILGGMTIPLMLITLGVSLARMEVGDLKRSAFLAALRLGMGFGLGLAAAEIMGLHGVARGVVILQSSMPVAVFNYLFAQRYNNQPAAVAGGVVLSTLLSFATLPVLLWYLI
ncbi:AEC family transporter [Varunaivibrio sulfuroxidans]|uniref:AEC family transporter n=1 Tax=Varunaivibrio sulfuroxidans TaxID=1773489 RepID=A0A4R3JEE2_9PROT|nr:AEC family transporter [Varunaivibrio sulfuroxidans]TCS63050.1 hypothetical protein EDD55_104141 [Varunaivibrio sulfuroxidans]WES31878.1 AEC family transporter [Varunaivibrio sulfuroxidans]